MRTLTVAQLSEESGRSKKAVRSLLDKKRLPYVVGSDGLRRVPEDAAIAYGLIGSEGQRGSRGTAGGTSGAAEVLELAERLMAVSEELGRMRALVEVTERREEQERSEVERLQARVFELEARLQVAETRKMRRWFSRLAVTLP